ncbi:MAG: LuxR C-terminal-related transcriptional regulator [Stenotrophobium sp.]
MRLLIVDDHPMTCAGLKSLLQACYPEASIDARHDVHALERHAAQCDYIFLDMHLPGVRFVELLDTVHAHLRRVILISASPEPEIVEQARARGVLGLLLKNANAEKILDGFRRIQAGERVFEESGDLLGARQPALTARQQQVFDALLGGLSNKQIARKLDISEHTVKDHVAAILTLFGARNRLDLLLLHQRQTAVV